MAKKTEKITKRKVLKGGKSLSSNIKKTLGSFLDDPKLKIVKLQPNSKELDFKFMDTKRGRVRDMINQLKEVYK